MYPDTLLVSFGSEIGQWGAIYRSTVIVIPGGKLEINKYIMFKVKWKEIVCFFCCGL